MAQRQRIVSLFVAAAVAAAAAAILALLVVDRPPSSGSAGSPSGSSHTPSAGPATGPAEAGACSSLMPFRPTFLPDGFDPGARQGIAPGAPPAEPAGDRPAQAVIHRTDEAGRAVEFRRPGTQYVELALPDDAPTITVLGSEVNDVAAVSPGGDDLIVQFTFPADAGEDPCALYSVNGYGLTEEELRRIAEGLVPAR